ncbi:restriction endonuclease subunit S [Lactobacillus delbrueckii]|uniref:restriction endonuclease subunit S n=1 Tax=Lactobacillus delbrueckii TaxID=1584 RepID=UPI002889F8B8|nr:restriction endonuclease subunit S [Lactobacillus delbrueckii]
MPGHARTGGRDVIFAWEQCKLKNKAEIVRGASPRPISNPKWFDDNSNVGWLRISDVTEQRGRIHHLSQRISKAGQSKTRVITEPHLLLSIAATVGSPVINYVNTGVHDGFLIFLNPTLDKEFMFQWLLMFKPYWNKYGQPESQVNLNSDIVGNQSVAFPTMSEQERIADFFSKLDTAITLHEEKKCLLERLKSALLQKMFADKSGYPAVRFKRYNSAWVLRRIIDLLNQAITDGPHETPCLVGKGIPFISADAIVNNKIDFSRKRGNITKEYDLECCKKYRPQMHDIYLVKSGSTVGKVAIVETTTRFNIWSPLAALRCGEKSDPYFVFFLMQTEKFQTQVKNKASNGTQPNLSMRALERFKVIVSIELSEQQAIGNLLKKVNELIDLHQHKIDNLIAIKQWLLQNMFI